MTAARRRLETSLHGIRRRLRAHILVQALAVAAIGTLAMVGAALWWLAREGFAPAGVQAARAALLLFLGLVAVLLAWRPLRQLRYQGGAAVLERYLPAQAGRIQTYFDTTRRDQEASALVDLLAMDAADIADRTSLEQVVPVWRIRAGAVLGGAFLLGLILLLVAGPLHWGPGSRHLLLGMQLPVSVVPVRRVAVAPGDVTVRRNSDLTIHASLEGFHPEVVQLYVRFADQQQWERAAMRAIAAERDPRFEFRLYAVRGPLQYYVMAQGVRSAQHQVAVVDLPRIERVRLTYDYPSWTGLEQATDDTSRHIRAVAGTQVKVEVFADAPLEAPALIVDGAASDLSQEGQVSRGSIEVGTPGRYQIGAHVAGELVALSEEYAIEVVNDEKPVIEIRKPGRDWRASSIEEVPVRINAEDDFLLRDVTLHYSINGGEWRGERLAQGNLKQMDAGTLLSLEELGAGLEEDGRQGLVAGDIVSYYATARDHRHSVETDLFMVQVQPFERRFLQGQGGGGGELGQEQGAISERQREILLATWNLQRRERGQDLSRRQLEDNAQLLAELQTTLSQQARTLARRTRARASVDQDERVRTFVEALERAATRMDPAAAHLARFELRDAVPMEQQALQQLLRAESAFREIQVSMQQDGSAGEGAQAARDFTEMFELEMDLEKNQYESQSQLARQNQQQDIDEAVRRLKALAERQEQLAQEYKRADLPAAQQRWKQEQLRREAEDLRQRLAQLNREHSAGQAQSQAQGQTQGEAQGEAQGTSGSAASPQAGQAGEERSQVARALESLEQALQEMRGSTPPTEAATDEAVAQAASEASRSLNQALQQLDQREPSQLDARIEQFADRAQDLVREQRRLEAELHRAIDQAHTRMAEPGASSYRVPGAIDADEAGQLVESKQGMSEALSALQGEMRHAINDNRQRTPQATQRLGEIVREVENSEVMYRLNRSAAEIYYGRAREAAAREGLIAESLVALERELRQAALLAAQEKREASSDATPDAVLAQIAELRRALQAVRRSGEPSVASAAAPGASTNGQSNASPSAASGQNQNRSAAAGSEALDETALMHQSAALGRQVGELVNRMEPGELTTAQLESLRRDASQLHRLSGDPMAGQAQAMLSLVDRIELMALAAIAQTEAARAAAPALETARDRETIAEYYRRLGSR